MEQLYKENYFKNIEIFETLGWKSANILLHT